MPRITIRKEGSHYVVSKNGRGFQIEKTKERANQVARRVRKELKR